MRAFIACLGLCLMFGATMATSAPETVGQAKRFLETKTLRSASSSAELVARITELDVEDISIRAGRDGTVQISPGMNTTKSEFASVLKVLTGDERSAHKMLEAADFMNISLLPLDGETIATLQIVRKAADRTEADPFAKIFGVAAPDDLELIQAGSGAAGQTIFRLARPWQVAARDVSALLSASGYQIYAMPGPSDTLMFAAGTNRTIVLFIQQDPSRDGARIVLNIQE